MDRVFGAENFIANLIWQGGRKNDSRYVSVGHDYMLIYAKNEGVLRQSETRWRERKPGVDEILARASEIWRSHDDKEAANKAYKKFLKGMAKKGATAGVLRLQTSMKQRAAPITQTATYLHRTSEPAATTTSTIRLPKKP